MFTREHFEKVASALSAARHPDMTPEVTQAIDKLADDFADMFAESNERFSRKAFIGACNAASRSEIRRLVNHNNVKTIARNKARDAVRPLAANGKPARRA